VIARETNERWYLSEKGQTVSFCTPWNFTNAHVSDSIDVSRHACDDQLVHLPELISTGIRARLDSDVAVGDLAEIGVYHEAVQGSR
jgi:hypothetical protein